MSKGKKAKVEKYTTNYSLYRLLSLEENQALALKNTERLSQIEATTLLFQEYEVNLNELKEEQEKKDEWENYLACDGLPHTHIPCEIREFLDKLTVFDEDDFLKSFSWTLTINERSILTQDVDAKNETRAYLKENLRKNIGAMYDKFISELLSVYKSVLRTLQTRFKVKSNEQYEDIKQLKVDIQEKMKFLYDKLTFRILSNENANMDPTTIRTSQYTYKAEHFALDIWTFQNVPITFELEDMPSLDVILKTIQIVVTLPFAVLCENLVLRGIYINYDHYSEFSRTSKINSNYVPVEKDLKKKLKQEWKHRIAIQKDIKEKMKEERRLFEEYLILKDLEEKENAKNKDNPKPKADSKKKKKPPLEPPIVDNNSFPDIEVDFTEFIQQEHINMQKQFAPELLELEEKEINLREYTPLGGIYEINFVHKTNQVIISNIIMKWFVQPIKLRYIDKITEMKEDLTLIERRSRRFTRIGVATEEKRFVHNFEIIFKIPQHVTKWSDPIVCQFCLGNDIVDMQKEQKNLENLPKTKTNILTTVPIILNDFNISGYLNNEQIYNIIQYALPRTISSYQIHEELHDAKKTGGGGLKKFKNVEEEEDLNDELNEAELINKKDLPERLFPKYPKLQPIVILENINKNITDDDKFFHDLINDFQQYQNMKQPYFIVRDLPTKKLKLLIDIEKKERAKRLTTRTTAVFNKGAKKGAVKKKGDIDDTATNITNLTNEPSDSVILDQLSVEEKIKSEEVIVEDDPDDIRKIKREEEFVLGSIRANEISDLEEDKTKWSTKHILSSHFNRERSELTVITDRLGVFAFMFPKFIHFPYKTWSLYPDPANPKENVIFYMESTTAKFTFKITEKGYFVDIRNFGVGTRTLQIFFKNEEPISNLTNLIHELTIRNLNVFPDPDSFAYIKGRLQEKIVPMELHNYNCMAVYSLFLKFSMSEWNWISDPRILIFKAGELRDKDDELTLIKITPEESSFVEIVELCSPDVDNIVLQYTPTWRNIEYNSDLVSLITTSYGGAYNNRIKDPRTYKFISKLLGAIRPLSSC